MPSVRFHEIRHGRHRPAIPASGADGINLFIVAVEIPVKVNGQHLGRDIGFIEKHDVRIGPVRGLNEVEEINGLLNSS